MILQVEKKSDVEKSQQRTLQSEKDVVKPILGHIDRFGAAYTKTKTKKMVFFGTIMCTRL